MVRENWVDYAKGLGIILVVIGHVNRGLYSSGIYLSSSFFIYLDSFLYTFHMPLFFFLSGLFFIRSIDKTGKKKFIFNKLDVIVYPYVIWSLIQGVIEFLLSGLKNSKTTIWDVLSFPIYPRAQFWFLYALFMIFIFSAIIYNKHIFSKYISIITLLSFFVCINSDVFGQSFHIDFITKYIFFFFLGCCFKNVSIYQPKVSWKFTFFAFILFVIVQYFFHFILKMTYENIGIMNTFVALVSICFIVLLSMSIDRLGFPVLKRIGELSMIVYLLHILAGSGSRIILDKIFHVRDWYVHMTCGLILGILVPIIFYSFSEKFKLGFLFSRKKAK